jgi:thiamine-phosphate pyrophosphorylase
MTSNFSQVIAGTRAYPLTDRQVSGLSHAEQVAKLADTGATLIQLREKLAQPADFYEDAKAAVEIARARGVTLIINDRVDIALALKADGVHLGQEDLPPEAARRILGPAAIIGFSTHNIPQARIAVGLPVDYIAIGPIFSTLTKVSTNPAVGLPEVTAVREAVGEFPLVAIGGITAENMRPVLAAGATVVSFIGDAWRPKGQLNPKISQFFKL